MLVNNFFIGLSTLVDIFKNVLSDFCLLGCCCSAKVVEITIEPFVDFAMDSIVIVTNFLTSFAFLHSLSFGSGSVLISTADINGVMSS